MRTALLVPVPAADPVVGALRRRFDPSARHGLPAHVTVLVPFVEPSQIDDGMLSALAERFAAVPAFDFRLTRVDGFAGVVYLAPEPAEPFRELTEDLARRYGTPPYEGAHDNVVPHLTIAMEDGENVTMLVEAEVEPHLPLAARADTVELRGEAHDGTWRVERRFALGA